jgi:hypothetical protein
MGRTQSEPRDVWSARFHHPAVPYVAPFAAFLLILSVQDYLRFLGVWEAPLRFLVLGLAILLLARRAGSASRQSHATCCGVRYLNFNDRATCRRVRERGCFRTG